MLELKAKLDAHVLDKNTDAGLFSYADPLQIASRFKDPTIALICALFAYGNAKLIVKFLNSLDFRFLDESENEIRKFYKTHKYRFQNTADVAEIFITLSRLKKDFNMEQILKQGFKKNGLMIEAINALIEKIYSLNPYKSDGYEFFFGRTFDDKPTSPYKRYNMFLRWMVRDTDIDLGLFKSLPKSELLMPLDVHTHRVSLNLGLCKRKSYDFLAVMDLTKMLREFDPLDPIKYDFALYRIGQGKELNSL
ncbi:TIGR02757 family protein [Campylobacter mucosalis]|uniref:TIGR02757 family protein n=1 Tax=Campylobacter mucosalis TaxID=202 RepID=UPI00146FF0CF|nr:TIGR02757 family protein [Campylobacter mucosalis]